MKRSVLLILIVILTVGTVAVAQESVLIDFTQLTRDFPADNPIHNQRTMIDYSSMAGTSFSDEEKAEMRISLAIDSWEVELSRSAARVGTMTNSVIRSAPVREGASRFGGDTVIGVRVNFPNDPFNAWAMVRPPFEVKAYADLDEVGGDGTLVIPQEELGRGRKFDGFGVVKNVGVIRSVSMNVLGLNFPHKVSLVLQDENNVQREIMMGDLQFDGWRTLEWRNPNYLTEVRNRELQVLPMYPALSPHVKLIGIRIYRNEAHHGGDFVSYIRDISLTYDRAILHDERDVDDEAVWGILSERERNRRESELRRVGSEQVLRYLEQRRMFGGENGGANGAVD